MSHKTNHLPDSINVLRFDDLIREGERNLCEPFPPSPDDVATICYTSGTTGSFPALATYLLTPHNSLGFCFIDDPCLDLPKGTVLTHRNIIANIAGMLHTSGLQIEPSDVHLW